MQRWLELTLWSQLNKPLPTSMAVHIETKILFPFRSNCHAFSMPFLPVRTRTGGKFMKIRDKHYRDFSNRKPFNNIPCKDNEELVPVVLNEEMRTTLMPAGLDLRNVEKWLFPNAKERFPVVFVPNGKGHMDEAISWLGREASRYLKHKTDFISDDLSIDEFMEGIDDEDSTGFDPTATTKYEDSATLMMTLDMLLDDLAALDPQSAKIIALLDYGYERKELISILGKKKSQAYALINKAQKLGNKIYTENYR